MRRILLILIPVILVLIILLILHALRGPDVIEISSDDNRVRLVIPQEALVVGSDADTIRIVTSDPASTAPVHGLEQPLFAYRFEPEGLRFRQPVRLVVDAGYWGRHQLPMLLHRTATHLEALKLDVVVTGERVESVTAELQHFSEVLGFLSVMSVQIDDPPGQPVGGPFFINASVGVIPSQIHKFELVQPNPLFWTLQRVDTPVKLSAGRFEATGTLTPASVPDNPAALDLNPINRHVEPEIFECTAQSTSNIISYTVKLAFKLLLSSSDDPDDVAEVPIDDTLTVRSQPFACLAPAPAPDYYSTVDFPAFNDDWFYAEISKNPAGWIPVGQDFTLKARVGHRYEGSATPDIANWELKYGRFEIVQGDSGVITPRRTGDLPAAAAVAAEDYWSGSATFRCMNPGTTTIRYHGSVYYPAPPDVGNGLVTIAVQADATVTCKADPNVTGTINALPDSGLGPLMNTLYGNQSGFQMRWWREPGAERIRVGQSFNIRVELQNLRSPAGAAPWRISGNLNSTDGVLSPTSYMEAPASGTVLNPGATWSGNYQFTCQNVGGTTLAHNFTIDGVTPASSMGVPDSSLDCVGD